MPFRSYASPSTPSYGGYGSSTASSYANRNSGSSARSNASSTSGNLRSSYSPLNSANRLTSSANAKNGGDYNGTSSAKSYGTGQNLGTGGGSRERSVSKDRYNDSANSGYKTSTNSYMKDYSKPSSSSTNNSGSLYGTSERSRTSDRSPSTSHSYSTPKKVVNDTFLSPSMYTPKINRSVSTDRNSEDKTPSSSTGGTTSNSYMTPKVSPYKGYTRTSTTNYDKTLATPKYTYGRATTRDLSSVSSYARSTSVQDDKRTPSSYGYGRSISTQPATTPSITVTAIPAPEPPQATSPSKSDESDESEEESEEEEEVEEEEEEEEEVVKLTTRGTSPNRIPSSNDRNSFSATVEFTQPKRSSVPDGKRDQESQTDIAAQTVSKTPPTTPTTRSRFIGYTGYNAPSYSTYTPRYTGKYSGKYSSTSSPVTTSSAASKSTLTKLSTPPRSVTSPTRTSPLLSVTSPTRTSPLRSVPSPTRTSPIRSVTSPARKSPARSVFSPSRQSPIRSAASPARKTPPLSVVVTSARSSSSPSRCNSKSPSPAAITSKLPTLAVNKPPPSPTTTISKPPLPGGNAASKEFRKSPLNLNLDDRQTEEYRKKQDELRKTQRSLKKSSSFRKNSLPDSSKSSSSISVSRTPSKGQVCRTPSKKVVAEARSSSCSSTSSAASSTTSSSSSSTSSSRSASKAVQVPTTRKSSSDSRSLSFVEASKLKRAGSTVSTANNRSGPPSRQSSFASGSRSNIPAKVQSRNSSRTSIPNDTTSRNPSRISLCPSTASLATRSPSAADMSSNSAGGHRRGRTVSKTDSRSLLVDVSAELARVNSRNSLYSDKSARRKNSSSSDSVSGTVSRRNSKCTLPTPRMSIAAISTSSESSDSSTSAAAANPPVEEPVSQPAAACQQSSFLDRLTSPFGLLRRNPSEAKAWWLPSTNDVPAALAVDGNTEGRDSPLKPSSTAICMRDVIVNKQESPSSASNSESAEESTTEESSSEEEESQGEEEEEEEVEEEEEGAATEEEVSDLEGDKELPKFEAEEILKASIFSRQNSPDLPSPLGDRTSPDGFEWPTPSTPPPRTNIFSSSSAYEQIKPVEPSVPERKLDTKSKKASRKFIGELKDIDSLLREPSVTESFEDFEARYSSPEKEECNDSDKDSSEDQGQDVLDRVAGSNMIPDTSHAKSEEDDDETDTDDKDKEPAAVGLHTSYRQQQVSVEVNDECNHNAESDRDSTQDDKEAIAEPEMLEDAALQLYKDGDYGTYLDLEATLHEQADEFEGFLDNKKNSIVLRTQLSVRVHAIIEKLLNSDGRELRRALFSLKQIFQEDKDLVHEFVQSDGLACLIQVGHQADQNYQNYILRALGQVMLYVDGMNGVMEHNETIQWLYSLTASKYRLVVKTALKLMLVFVEYVETNCHLLIKAIHAVDNAQGQLPWTNIMAILQERDASDDELLVYATTLINKTLNGLPDQDSYYDQTDCLEELGMEHVIHRFKNKPGADRDLLQQLAIYEAELHKEDGDEEELLPSLQSHLRHAPRSRRLASDNTDDRRKSRRHSTTSPKTPSSHDFQSPVTTPSYRPQEILDSWSSSATPSPTDAPLNPLGFGTKPGDAGVTPALRRRRERAERHRSFIQEQEGRQSLTPEREIKVEDPVVKEENRRNAELSNEPNSAVLSPTITAPPSLGRKELSLNLSAPLTKTASRKDVDATEALSNNNNSNNKKPWMLSMMYGGKNAESEENGSVILPDSNGLESLSERIQNLQNKDKDPKDERRPVELSREATVKDLTERLQAQVTSPSEEKPSARLGDLSGIISKAKEGLILSKSKSRPDLKGEVNNGGTAKVPEVKKSETELHWEQLVQKLSRPLHVCDLDFTDLKPDDDSDPLCARVIPGIPPPPPPMSSNCPPPPPPLINGPNIPPPLPKTLSFAPPPIFGVRLNSPSTPTVNGSDFAPKTTSTPKKSKKTVKLFWREVRDDGFGTKEAGTIWDEIRPISVDTQRLEHLFESRSKDLMSKKQQEIAKNKTLVVLDPKRSNAINIGMTKLPPPRTIKTAILKMDSTIINREGIEKLLTMLPTDEERAKIQEAQIANPDVPLGNAEQFLLTLASIPELPARLRLWLFKSDYDNMEKEVAEPLMDLKQGIEVLQTNHTFRCILSTLLAVGNFLNGLEVKGFQVEYLAKVPEVKDTVHKHSLLHHLCHMVMETFPDETTDLYSEIGAVTRASRVDFDELAANLVKMEQDCKASWDYLRAIAKHDTCSTMKVKTSEFLADCAERIIVLGIVHRRILNRFHKFLLYLGTPPHVIRETKPGAFCKIVSEFALEYRTTRERVLQQFEKKANHRERNKTRGKMITEVGSFRNPVTSKEDRADAELRQLLGSDMSDTESIRGTLTWNRSRSKTGGKLGRHTSLREEYLTDTMTDGDDDILESLVKTATQAPVPRNTPRERKRARQADRKSLKRSRTRDNNVFQPLMEERL